MFLNHKKCVEIFYIEKNIYFSTTIMAPSGLTHVIYFSNKEELLLICIPEKW